MKPYHETELGVLYLGNCLEAMKGLDPESVDLMVTDPPYGYAFMGKDWDKAVPSVETWRECLRVMKPGAFAFIMSAPRQDVLSHMIVNLEAAGFKTGFTSIYWTYATGFPKAQNISKAVDKKKGVEREVVGIKSGDRYKYSFSHGFNTKDKNSKFGAGDAATLTAPATPEAKALDGSYAGFQPKPAVEVVLVVIKPLSEKTYVEQALKNGKGITWLDSARVPIKDLKNEPGYRPNAKNHSTNTTGGCFGATGYTGADRGYHSSQGRFPANLLVSDDVLDDGLERKSGTGFKGTQNNMTSFSGFKGDSPNPSVGGDSGSYSRYFSLDAWWAERIKTLPDSVRKTFPFIVTPKASKSEKNKGCEGVEGRTPIRYGEMKGTPEHAPNRQNKQTNYHPTVKPLKLMSYLVTIGSQEGDTVLDPFMGSGTTGVTCKIEGRRFIGIEMNQDYLDIAIVRLKGEQPQLKLPL